MSFAYLFERFPSFTQTFCNREVAEMIAQGMRPEIFSIRGADEGNTFPPELAARVRYLPPDNELNREVRRLRAEHRIHSGVWEIFSTWGDRGDKARLYEAAWLGLELKRLHVRHVHAHFAGMAARTAYWLRKFWGITYSFTGHANDIFCETNFPVSLAEIVAEARLVVTETDFSRDWLREKFPRHAGRIERCYNGIDVERFAASEAHGGALPRIISVGRYVEKKGFSDLIDACASLRERGVKFECDIVGSGPLEEALRSQIDRLALAENVRLTGSRSEPEVIEMLRGAAVFALPCVREADGGSDNLPTVIMEAMAIGLPIVSTRIAGVPEMVVDGVTGFLVAERDPAQTAGAIETLLADSGRARRFGGNGRELVARRFATAVTTRRLKHLLVSRCRVAPAAAALAADPRLGIAFTLGAGGLGSWYSTPREQPLQRDNSLGNAF